MVWLICLIFSACMTLIFLGMSGDPSAGDVTGMVIAFIILDLIFLNCYLRSRKKKKKKIAEAAAQKENLQSLGALSSVTAKHMAGLAIAQGVSCSIYLCEDKVIFQKDSNTFNLLFSKVLDVTVKTDVEIQKQYISSVGGAVGGAVLFGPLGAMIGGRAKEKKNKIIYSYLIYTYQKNDQVEYISFDVTGIPYAKLQPFVEHYKSLQIEPRVVDL